MKSTHVNGREVFITEGMIDGATGGTIYGLFACEADARSDDADSLVMGTVGADALTDEQMAVAAANSAELAD